MATVELELKSEVDKVRARSPAHSVLCRLDHTANRKPTGVIPPISIDRCCSHLDPTREAALYVSLCPIPIVCCMIGLTLIRSGRLRTPTGMVGSNLVNWDVRSAGHRWV